MGLRRYTRAHDKKNESIANLKYIFAEFEEIFKKDGWSDGYFTAEDFLAELVV